MKAGVAADHKPAAEIGAAILAPFRARVASAGPNVCRPTSAGLVARSGPGTIPEARIPSAAAHSRFPPPRGTDSRALLLEETRERSYGARMCPTWRSRVTVLCPKIKVLVTRGPDQHPIWDDDRHDSMADPDNRSSGRAGIAGTILSARLSARSQTANLMLSISEERERARVADRRQVYASFMAILNEVAIGAAAAYYMETETAPRSRSSRRALAGQRVLLSPG
jgi:hypothetical protein